MFKARPLHTKPPFNRDKKEPERKTADIFWHNFPSYFLSRLRSPVSNFKSISRKIDEFGNDYKDINKRDLQEVVEFLKASFQQRGLAKENICRSFALIREQAKRTLGTRHYTSQLLGGWVMLNGMIAEMETGEGKTLTAPLAAITLALSNIPVHIITVNDYLAKRDAKWMKPLYNSMGISVGAIQNGMSPAEKKEAYNLDVVYCTNKEIVFDYLRDHLSSPAEISPAIQAIRRLCDTDGRGQRLLKKGLCCALVDEADSVFIDEAVTPLIISGEGAPHFDETTYQQALKISDQLTKGKDFTLEKKGNYVQISEKGSTRLEELTSALGELWSGKRQREFLVEQALRALHLLRRDKEYVVTNNTIQIVDEYTGRILQDRSWQDGLHQMIECKEGCPLSGQKETLARISYQKFFNRYHLLAGMSGTVKEVRKELWDVYNLQVVYIPPNIPLVRQRIPTRFFLREEEKFAAIIKQIKLIHRDKTPVLIGTPHLSVSEKLKSLLTKEGLKCRVLNALQDKKEAEIIALAGRHGQITVATNMAGRGTDIKLEDGVETIGGLHVIATEMHSAARIDRQLFGRCGRQGNPGSYQLFISMDDEIFTPFHSSFSLSLLKILLKTRIGVLHPIRDLITRYLQRTLENKMASARKLIVAQDKKIQDGLGLSGKGE